MEKCKVCGNTPTEHSIVECQSVQIDNLSKELAAIKSAVKLEKFSEIREAKAISGKIFVFTDSAMYELAHGYTQVLEFRRVYNF